MEVFETPLPGLGVRYEFVSEAGGRLAVVVRRDARRELVVFDRRDPDAASGSIVLTRAETATLVELLGGTKLTERIADLRHQIEGLAIQWVTVPQGGGMVGRTLGEARLRTATGAMVVAVLRGDGSIPGPGPDQRLHAGDIAVVVGSSDNVDAALALLTR